MINKSSIIIFNRLYESIEFKLNILSESQLINDDFLSAQDKKYIKYLQHINEGKIKDFINNLFKKKEKNPEGTKQEVQSNIANDFTPEQQKQIQQQSDNISQAKDKKERNSILQKIRKHFGTKFLAACMALSALQGVQASTQGTNSINNTNTIEYAQQSPIKDYSIYTKFTTLQGKQLKSDTGLKLNQAQKNNKLTIVNLGAKPAKDYSKQKGIQHGKMALDNAKKIIKAEGLSNKDYKIISATSNDGSGTYALVINKGGISQNQINKDLGVKNADQGEAYVGGMSTNTQTQKVPIQNLNKKSSTIGVDQGQQQQTNVKDPKVYNTEQPLNTKDNSLHPHNWTSTSTNTNYYSDSTSTGNTNPYNNRRPTYTTDIFQKTAENNGNLANTTVASNPSTDAAMKLAATLSLIRDKFTQQGNNEAVNLINSAINRNCGKKIKQAIDQISKNRKSHKKNSTNVAFEHKLYNYISRLVDNEISKYY